MLQAAIVQLKDRQLLVEGVYLVRLTDADMNQHSACLRQQHNFRQTAMKGISEEGYATTVATLQELVGNISDEVAPDSVSPAERGGLTGLTRESN